ncbi:MAG: glucose-6-phosphate dehydrogenase, partial [Cyclobacteriaceae bacterium]
MLKKPEKHILVIFGASGDLAYRKLLPAIFDLYEQDLLPAEFAVLGVSRTDMSDDKFRKKMAEGIHKFSIKNEHADKIIDDFLPMLHYHSMDPSVADGYESLKNKLKSIDKECDNCGNYIFYLSTPPSLYEPIAINLGKIGLSKEQKGYWRRLIIEKPFGYDSKSGKKLNKVLLDHFDENQLYRIDHYLGKETVQNLL